MILKTSVAIVFLFLLTSFSSDPEITGIPLQDKKLVYRDAVYELEIKTVQLYPSSGSTNDVLLPSVAPVNNNTLLLEFDDLVEAPENYRVKIIHCDWGWKPSRLRSLDYLYEFNEFNIIDYELSVDTKLAYVHYKFKVPNVKIPGNYLLVAYRGTDESDIILSKRFMLYNNSLFVNLTSDLIGLSSANRINQQIDFTINYNDVPLINPLDNVHVVIRQNQRWDNAITTLKPNAIRESASELEYRFFNYENNFMAGNEFRFFDMRSLRYPGQNVQRTSFETRPTSIILMTDRPRIYQPYTQYDEINGNFFVANLDTGHGPLQGDYVTTKFSLKADKVNGQVYIIGKMNNWGRNNKMTYDENTKTYHGEMILKQGYYNYQYFVEGGTVNDNYFEGNHFQTENDYEIFIYYNAPTSRSDLLLGYKKVTLNPVN